MDWDDNNVHHDVKKATTDEKVNEKVKKKVVIDENNEVRPITAEENRERSQARQNFESTGWPWTVAAVFFLIGFIFNTVSYGTPFWLQLDNGAGGVLHIGIWSACVDSISDCTFRKEITGCLNSVRVFGGVGVLSGVTVVILLVLYINKPESRRCLGLSTVILCFISALAIQIATAIFGRSIGCYDIQTSSTGSTVVWNWALAFAFVSVLVTIATGLVFMIIELRLISRQTGRKRPWNGSGMVIT